LKGHSRLSLPTIQRVKRAAGQALVPYAKDFA
jgi:hypothetical protein